MKVKNEQARAALGLWAALAAQGAVGCLPDNRLPPSEVPKITEERALPRWYPEKPWSEKAGQSQVFIEGKIVFDTDRALLRPGSEKVLQTLLQFLKEHPEVTRLRIEGHTDARASEEHNQELSAKRALAVADWLVEHGVEHLRLIAVGFGPTRPLGPNELAAGRSENRRTEFHVAEVNGRPFQGSDPYAGGMPLTVLSLDERKAQAAEARRRFSPPPRKAFVATGDEVKPVEVKPRVEALPVDEAPRPAEPPKAEPPKDGG
jgi:OmpA-OmpF porin, OOP family